MRQYAYAAGLIDGEGTITLTRNGNEKRFPVLSIASTTYALVAFMKRLFGGCITNKRKYKKGHSKSFVWRVRYNRALRALALVLPFMLEPEKVRRGKLVLAKYKSVTAANGKYTKEILKEKARFEREFFSGRRRYARNPI